MKQGLRLDEIFITTSQLELRRQLGLSQVDGN